MENELPKLPPKIDQIRRNMQAWEDWIKGNLPIKSVKDSIMYTTFKLPNNE